MTEQREIRLQHDGQLIACTLGEFIATIVDKQERDAIIFREVKADQREDDQYILKLEVLMVPYEHLRALIADQDVPHITRVARNFMHWWENELKDREEQRHHGTRPNGL